MTPLLVVVFFFMGNPVEIVPLPFDKEDWVSCDDHALQYSQTQKEIIAQVRENNRKAGSDNLSEPRFNPDNYETKCMMLKELDPE